MEEARLAPGFSFSRMSNLSGDSGAVRCGLTGPAAAGRPSPQMSPGIRLSADASSLGLPRRPAGRGGACLRQARLRRGPGMCDCEAVRKKWARLKPLPKRELFGVEAGHADDAVAAVDVGDFSGDARGQVRAQ